MDSSKVGAIIAASRRAAFESDPSETLDAIDGALALTTDPGHRGRLLLGRALAQQGLADTGPAAIDARASLGHLLDAGATSEAAFAMACAAGMVHRTGDVAEAIDLAVEALVLLPADDLSDDNLVRAANAMAMMFNQLSAFDLALLSSRRAFAAAMELPALDTRSVAAYTLGYCATAAARSTSAGVLQRDRLALDIEAAIGWLTSHEVGPIQRAVLGSGMQAERVLIDHLHDEIDTVRTTVAEDPAPLESIRHILDDAAHHYQDTAPRLAAWHQLVRASVRRHMGDNDGALALLDQAIPELEGAGDEHRVVRAYNERSAALASSGELMAALDDARTVAHLARSWQQHQVGRLAHQISHRAELEQARAQLRRRADDLARQAAEDPITGLGTRRWLEMRLEELSRSDGEGSVIVLDLDSFKRVNDTFGHQTGDVVLQRVGRALSSVVRDGNPVARYGGEEFVVLAPDLDQATATALAERIRRELHAIDWNEVADDLEVTVSAGVAAGPLAGVRELLRVADTALYEAKRTGRDRVVTY